MCCRRRQTALQVTPLLWALMITQMLLSIAMACIYMMLLAVFQSCNEMSNVQDKLEKKLEETQASVEEAAAAQVGTMDL